MKNYQQPWAERPSAAAIRRSVLKLGQYVLAIKDDEILPKHKGELLHILVWKITEANGKHNTRYISEGVYRGQGPKRHEHVLTRKHLVERMLREPENLQQILDTAIGCVVTSEEHKVLTAAASCEGWERYRKAQVRVYDRRDQKWLKFD